MKTSDIAWRLLSYRRMLTAYSEDLVFIFGTTVVAELRKEQNGAYSDDDARGSWFFGIPFFVTDEDPLTLMLVRRSDYERNS